MPKFLYTKITIRTLETWASSEDEGHEILKRWQEGESEEIEGGVKATSYKLNWVEFQKSDEEVIEGRNQVLANFLEIMKNRIPGMPKLSEEKSLIVKPFDPFPDVSINRDRKQGKL